MLRGRVCREQGGFRPLLQRLWWVPGRWGQGQGEGSHRHSPGPGGPGPASARCSADTWWGMGSSAGAARETRAGGGGGCGRHSRLTPASQGPEAAGRAREGARQQRKRRAPANLWRHATLLPPPPPPAWPAGHDAQGGTKRVPGNPAEGLGAPPRTTQLGTHLCRRTFCRDRSSSRWSGEHSLGGGVNR